LARAIEGLKQIVAHQATKLALGYRPGIEFDPPITSTAFETSDIGLFHAVIPNCFCQRLPSIRSFTENVRGASVTKLGHHVQWYLALVCVGDYRMDVLAHCRAMAAFCRQRVAFENENDAFWLSEAEEWHKLISEYSSPQSQTRTVQTARSRSDANDWDGPQLFEQ
jgi:hypothetical protein